MAEVRKKETSDERNANGSGGDVSEELAVEILINVQSFLSGGWTKLTADQLVIDVISGGYCNRVYRVQRPDTGPSDRSPVRVLYRKYGGQKLGTMIREHGLALSEAQETLICYELGRTGRGPAIHGVFAGGRIEEYIEGETLGHEDMCDARIMRQAGQAFAAFHALRLPLPDHTAVFWNELNETMDAHTTAQLRAQLQHLHPDADLTFLDWDLNEPKEWIRRTLPRIGSPIVLMHRDNNLLNFMVRHSVRDGGQEVLIIDYEMSRYGVRAFDLGSFFVNKTLKWNGVGTKDSGSAFPTAEARGAFLKGYADQLQSADQQQLALEAEFGAVMVTVLMSAGMRKAAVQVAQVEPAFLTLVPHLRRLYHQLRPAFHRAFPPFS